MPGCRAGGDLTISHHDRYAQMPRGGDQWTIGRIAVRRNGKCAVDCDIWRERLLDRWGREHAGKPPFRIRQKVDGVRTPGLLNKPISQAEIGEMYTASASPAWVISSAADFAIGSPFAR
jgi:hypothetical protein